MGLLVWLEVPGLVWFPNKGKLMGVYRNGIVNLQRARQNTTQTLNEALNSTKLNSADVPRYCRCTLRPLGEDRFLSLLLPTAGFFIGVRDRLVSPVWHDKTNNKILGVSCLFSPAQEMFYSSAVPCFRTSHL